jgi:hypothetical protein
LYGAAGGIGMFCAHASVFVMAGTWVALLIGGIRRDQDRQARKNNVRPLAVIAVAWAVLLAINYVLFLRLVATGENNAGLRQFWENAEGFMPTYPPAIFPWIWHTFWKIIHEPSTMWIDSADLAMLCAMVGLVWLSMRRRMAIVMLVLPLPLAIFASLLRRYPFADRLALWTVPTMLILIAAGIDRLWGNRSGGWRLVFGIVVTLMIGAASFTRALYQTYHTEQMNREESQQVYKYIARLWQPGDIIYLHHNANLSFYYYGQMNYIGLDRLKPLQMRTPLEPFAYEGYWKGYPVMPGEYPAAPGAPAPGDKGYFIVQGDHESDISRCADEIDHLQHPLPEWKWPAVRRVWVVFAHAWNQEEMDFTVREFDRHALRLIQPFYVDGTNPQGACVYLYDMSQPPQPTPLKPANQN